MTIDEILVPLTGEWSGVNRLYLPEQPALESGTGLVVQTAAREKFVLFRYTWVYEGETQEGLLLVGQPSPDNIQASWIDSWHMDRVMMVLDGVASDGSRVSLRGSYAAPPGPDWGWRIDIAPQPIGLDILMFNISPEGDTYPAVEATYTR